MIYQKKVGFFGEKLACDYLLSKGYEIIEQNLRIKHKEIDILAKKQHKTIFIEVKTRLTSGIGQAADSLDRRKIRRLTQAIASYADWKKLDPQNLELEFLAIDLDYFGKKAKIKHYKGLL